MKIDIQVFEVYVKLHLMRKTFSKKSAYYSTKRLPADFIARLDEMTLKDKRQKILLAFTKRMPTTFRVNTLKTNSQELLVNLKKQGFTLSRIPWNKNAFLLLSPSQRKLMDTQYYKNGEIYLQSLSSMIPAMVLNPQPGEKVLDICAAPGSKTTQVAAMMNNQGELVANDINQIRIYKLESNLKQQGVTNVIVTKMAAETVWLRIPESVDKTLVDVPCSLEGRFNVFEPKTFTQWSVRKVKYLSKHQKWILRSAVSATKVGGTIVYSTCTLSPEENEEVIDWILNKEKGALRVEKIALPGFKFDEPVLNWQGKNYDSQIKNAVRIWPGNNMEGFFIAKLKKIKPTVNQT